MALDLNTLGYSGVLTLAGSFAAKRLYDWFKSDRQGSSLYEVEMQAHIATRARFEQERQQLEADLEEERKGRKAAEMELRETNKAHDEDRKAWRGEREQTQQAMNALREEVFRLNQKVTELTNTVNRKQHNGPT
jgi:chromosome segregation ATPase